jgi:hypothetical protein
MKPLMPSPGNPKTVSTPHSINRSTNRSEAVSVTEDSSLQGDVAKRQLPPSYERQTAGWAPASRRPPSSEILGLPCIGRYGELPDTEFQVGNLTLAVMQNDAFGQAFSPTVCRSRRR